RSGSRTPALAHARRRSVRVTVKETRPLRPKGRRRGHTRGWLQLTYVGSSEHMGRHIVVCLPPGLHHRAAPVPFALVDYEPAAGPPPMGLPGGAQWAADVEAPVDQNGRDAGEPFHSFQQRGVTESSVRPVMRRQGDEVVTERPVIPPGITLEPTSPDGDVGILP